jgi:hypothetical protein
MRQRKREPLTMREFANQKALQDESNDLVYLWEGGRAIRFNQLSPKQRELCVTLTAD